VSETAEERIDHSIICCAVGALAAADNPHYPHGRSRAERAAHRIRKEIFAVIATERKRCAKEAEHDACSNCVHPPCVDRRMIAANIRRGPEGGGDGK